MSSVPLSIDRAWTERLVPFIIIRQFSKSATIVVGSVVRTRFIPVMFSTSLLFKLSDVINIYMYRCFKIVYIVLGIVDKVDKS